MHFDTVGSSDKRNPRLEVSFLGLEREPFRFRDIRRIGHNDIYLTGQSPGFQRFAKVSHNAGDPSPKRVSGHIVLGHRQKRPFSMEELTYRQHE